MFFNTVRIVVETNSATEYGTGFFVEYTFDDDLLMVYLVTAAHLFENGSRGSITFLRKEDDKPLLQPYVLEVNGFDKLFVQHPNERVDVAVAPFGEMLSHLIRDEGINPYWHATLRSDAAGPQDFDRMDSVEEIRFVGYPSGHYDRVNGLPIIRQGITATPPSIDYNGDPVFLIDGAVYFGSSGSPVFTNPNRPAIPSFRFLGVLSEMVRASVTGAVENVPPAITMEALRTARLLNLGIVYKTATIYEAIEHHARLNNWPAAIRDALRATSHAKATPPNSR